MFSRLLVMMMTMETVGRMVPSVNCLKVLKKKVASMDIATTM